MENVTNSKKELVFVVERNSSFTTNSIINSLQNEQIGLVTQYIDSIDLDGFENSYIMILAEKYVDENKHILAYLKKHCISGGNMLVIVGTNSELSSVKEIIPSNIIALELVRPIDGKTIATKVNEMMVRRIQRSIPLEEDKKKHVLVVDDSGVMLRTIMSWLEDRYQVSLANSAKTATMALSRSIPDLILLDYEMPECSGAEFMASLKAEPETKDIPIIFLTSKDDIETVREVVAMNPQGYLLKTTPRDLVLEKVDAVIRK